MAAVTEAPAWAKELRSDISNVKKALEEQASKPAGRGVTPGTMFGGFAPAPAWDDPGLQRNLARLKVYDSDAVNMMCRSRTRGGGPRLSGCGPALIKMAALAGNADARSVAKSIGMSDDYGEDQFENQHQFTTVMKAAKHGIKGSDGQVRKTALAEASGVTGGYVVPPQFMNELLTIAAEDAFIEPRAKIAPMNTRTVDWPMLDLTTVQAAGTTPYFGGIYAQWQPEAATIGETEPQFKQTTWTAWDLVLYCVSSNQLLADNGIGLDALLTQLFGQAITWYKEYAYLRGTGSNNSMPLGVLNAPATINVANSVTGHFTLKSAASMMSHLQIRSWDDACWIMHQSVLPELIQMSDISTAPPGSAGQHLTWLPPFGENGAGPTGVKMPKAFLNALPIFFTEKLPQLGTTGCVLLADWSRYVIGMRLDFQLDVSPHYLFRTNQLAWRVVARLDGKPWLNGPIVDAEGFQVSPFVVTAG